jgi:hypothetical protein
MDTVNPHQQKVTRFIICLFAFFLIAFSISQAQTNYYSKSAGNLNTLATWGTNTDGSGTTPLNFTSANCTYIIVNQATPTISANWTVSGASSVIQVGNGVQVINFTIPTPRTVVAKINVMSTATLTGISGSIITGCTISVANNAFLIIQSALNPILGVLSAGSTVSYSRAANQTIVNAAYDNLILGGTGIKTLANTANTSVSNVLTINTGISLALNTNTTFTLALNGTLLGSGTITGGANSNLTIGGSGTFGTIIPTAAPLTIRNLSINRLGSGIITLGGNLTVSTTFSFSAGILNLNGKTLTLNGAVTFPATLVNGSFSGSSTSNLSIGATSIINNLFFTSGTQTLNNFTLNSAGQTLKLGSNLTVSGAYAHTRGIVNINGNTLSLTGTATFASTVANGTTSGSSTSNLLISATTITNSLFMTVGSQTLSNFTLNSPVKTLTLGTALTVSGVFNQTNGIIALNAQVLTLTGTVVFPINSTNGTITGSNTSDLVISATAISNPLYFTAAALTLRNLTLNSPGQTLILGTALTTATTLTHTNGILNLNGKTLTLNGSVIFPATATNGSFSGSSTSNLSIGATSIINNLFFTSGSQTLNNFTLNSVGQTLKLGSNLTVSGAYAHTRGIVNINGNTLSLTGTATFASTVANGTTSGSSTSNLLISATTITNSLFMTVGSQTLSNFTLNSPGKTLTLGTALTVSGVFNQTKGIINLNSQVLTLNGTAIFPLISANGTITGSNTSDLVISATAISNPLYFTAAALTLRNLTLNSPGQTLTLGTALTTATTLTHTNGILNLNGKTLTLNGSVTFPATIANGSFLGSSTSSIIVGGTGTITNSMLMSQTNSSTQSMSSIIFNRAAQTLTLGNGLSIINEITPTAGTIASIGNLTLTATSASVTGRIGTIGVSGSITGNVTSQSFASGGNTGWALLGSAGITGRTFADWNDNFVITCASCPNGSMVMGAPFTSISSYNESAGGTYSNTARYVDVSSITTAITPAKGYWVYLGNSTTSSSNIKFDVTGPVNQGNKTINLSFTNIGGGTAADHGYNLIANPYPSPISWTLLRAANASVNNAIYVYNADLSGYATFVNGVSSPVVGSGGIGNMIPAGQGFYVKVSAATTLTAKETNKAASTQALLKLSQAQNIASSPALIRIKANGVGMHSETAIYFDSNASPYYESEYDAASIGADLGMLNVTSVVNDTSYAINGLEALTHNMSIPIKITTGTTGTYQIFADDFQNLPSGACLSLHDNFTNTDHDLRSGSYSCSISNTDTTNRFVLNITINNSISVISNAVNPSCSKLNNGYIVANASVSGIYDYYWKDSIGQIIKTSLNKATPDTLTNVSNGFYKVDITTPGTCSNGTENFHVLTQSNTNAFYSPSAINALLINDTIVVYFTNNSTNADSYLWDFGNGNISTSLDTSFMFTENGDYPVILYAINSACGDTSEYSMTINVTGGGNIVNAVKENKIGASKNIIIARDANGYFVQFNFTENSNAKITVWNIVGEKICEDLEAKNIKDDKVYIPIGSANNNLLIISVSSDNGESGYRKIIND